MADNYLITGYWGEPHVTAENDRGINAAMFGTGRFVLPVGEQFNAEYIGNNTIRMYDGKLMDNGAAAGIPVGEYVDLLIANAGQGMKRNDLIVFQYEQDSSTLIESGKFVVIQGAETSGTASDPALTQEDLLSGEAAFDQFALWRVSVSGATISAPVKLFSVHTINDYVVAQGTSGSWKYRKWKSGKAECWASVASSGSPDDLGNYGKLYALIYQRFPFDFAEVPVVIASGWIGGPNYKYPADGSRSTTTYGIVHILTKDYSGQQNVGGSVYVFGTLA